MQLITSTTLDSVTLNHAAYAHGGANIGMPFDISTRRANI